VRLREIEIPAEKARAVVDALEAATSEMPLKGTEERMPSFIHSNDPQLRQMRDELLDLKLKNAADTIVIRVGGIVLAAVWLMLIIPHAMR
jgi:hypothetical protein